MDVHSRSRFTGAVTLAFLAACGGTPHEPTRVTVAQAPAPDKKPREPDPDLQPRPVTKLLSIDWTTVPLATDADALNVWTTIAPTGADWEAKLDEIPVASARPLAIALLRAGNVTCMPAQQPVMDCAPLVLDVPPPAETATFADPCLRRLLALWSLAAIEPEDVPQIPDALRAIAAIPPPESQLIAAAIQAIPETDQDRRLELVAIAYRAGQRDLANGMLGPFDEAHLIEAVTRHKIDGALEVLSAEGHRAIYLAAVTDEALPAKARTSAINDLVVATADSLEPDLKKALVAATKSKDCEVAATAARALAARGDRRFLPSRPRTSRPDAMMRGLCVLASYERLQANDEPSLLVSYVPAKGLEQVQIAFDALAEVDTDGDGDPRTERTTVQVPRGELVVPESDDLVRAFRRCTGTTCTSGDRDFTFSFKSGPGGLVLTRLVIAERPPCPSR